MKKLLVLLPLLFAFACSGGGGGGSGSGSIGIRLLHGVIDIEPVYLQFAGNEGDFLAKTKYAGNTGYFRVPEGEQVLQVLRMSNTARSAASARGTIDPEAKYSLVFFGNTSGLGLDANLIAEVIPETAADQVAVKIIHALVGASSISATVSGEDLGSAAFGDTSAYKLITVPSSGVFNIVVKRTADGQTVARQPLALNPGKAYTLLVTGEVDLLVTLKNFQDN